MSKHTALITSSDKKYFPMMMELIHSLEQHKERETVDIHILNIDLDDEQKAILKKHNCSVFDADWPCPIPARKIKGRNYYKACVLRPFLRDLVPGYKKYIWLDSDCWVQDWESSLGLYIRASDNHHLAITAQVDRCYPKLARVKWLGPYPWKARSFYYSNARKPFGRKVAQDLFARHTLNAGAFCLEGDAPHWERWQELALTAIKKGKVFTAEQLTLGILVYLENYPVQILPATSNWMAGTRPLWNEKTQKFVEPYMPHNTIGIVHLSGHDDMRIDPDMEVDIKTLSGNVLQKSLRYGNG